MYSGQRCAILQCIYNAQQLKVFRLGLHCNHNGLAKFLDQSYSLNQFKFFGLWEVYGIFINILICLLNHCFLQCPRTLEYFENQIGKWIWVDQSGLWNKFSKLKFFRLGNFFGNQISCVYTKQAFNSGGQNGKMALGEGEGAGRWWVVSIAYRGSHPGSLPAVALGHIRPQHQKFRDCFIVFFNVVYQS